MPSADEHEGQQHGYGQPYGQAHGQDDGQPYGQGDGQPYGQDDGQPYGQGDSGAGTDPGAQGGFAEGASDGTQLHPEAGDATAYLRARYGEDVADPQSFGAWQGGVGEPPKRNRTPWLIGGLVAAVVIAGGGAWMGLRGSADDATTKAKPTASAPKPEGPEEIGRKYLTAWAAGDYAAMDNLVLEASDDVAGIYERLTTRLRVQKTVVTPGTFDAATASLPFTVTLTLQGLGDLSWDGSLAMVKSSTVGGASASAPAADDARSGWRVKFTSATLHPDLTNGKRIALVAGDGTKAGDPSRTAIVDRKGKPLASDEDLSANLVGTAPQGSNQGSGLLRAYADQLGGGGASSVAITDVTTGAVEKVLKTFPGKAGGKVTTTLDLTYQKAAEKALAKAKPGPHAAVVAIDTRTGAVLAMANKQIEGVPTAQNGLYPPGSTFKVITAIAGLEHGLTPSSKVECPNELSVVGKVFRNHEKARSTALSLTDAFAQSCNTAFINVARSLPEGALQDTARRFGFASAPGQADLLPVAAARGDLPDTPQAVDLAASAIGQGEVQATPLHMASVAAAIASGTWRQPRLVPDCADCESHPVPEAAAMRTLMRAVVTSGTGTGMRSVRGGPVYAKTGTPEWGGKTPPQTHGWLIGWQGHTAFAVFVENGSTGAAAAVPVAAAFLRALPAGH